MLENHSYSYISQGVCSEFRECDLNGKTTRLATTDINISSRFSKSDNMDPVGNQICYNNNNTNTNNNNNNTIGAVIDNDLHEDECNDLLFVGWPDTETLEDAENKLRSFNLTVGCGEFGDEDELSWCLSECFDGSDAAIKSDSYDENRMMIPNHSKQTQIHNQTEGKTQDQYFENYSFSCDNGIAFTSVKPYPSGYLQTGTPFLQSGIESEINSVTTLSSPIDSSLYLSFEASAISTDDDSKKLRYGYLNNPGIMDATCYDPTSVSTQAYYPEVENHSEVKRAKISINSDSLDVLEISCLNSELDVTTLEASRLHQLQQVLHQLDLRIRFCLKDGLYRLARSADQRSLSAKEDRDTNGIERTNVCNGLMDIETETNSIDRCIAHLLFHRSSDPSANSTCDDLSL